MHTYVHHILKKRIILVLDLKRMHSQNLLSKLKICVYFMSLQYDYYNFCEFRDQIETQYVPSLSENKILSCSKSSTPYDENRYYLNLNS